jgi:hypothetical protein
VSGSYTLTVSTWTTRQLNTTVRDPNGIIDSTDYGNYQFDLLDGDYLSEFYTSAYISNTNVISSRLRDVDNNVTLLGSAAHIKEGSSSGTANQEFVNTSYGEFTLANAAPTTIQFQTYAGVGSATAQAMVSNDGDNLTHYGVWNSVVKLWKIG